MSKKRSAPLINRLPPNTEPTYFDIFSDESQPELVNPMRTTVLLAGLIQPRIILTELHRYNHDASVYYGKIANGPVEGLDAVIKIGPHRQMADEAREYWSMRDLYKKIIPVCHGFYELFVAGMHLGVLILERFGVALTDNFMTMSRSEKTTLLNLLLELHSRGKVHNDLDPSNVLESDFSSGDLRLIDFGDIDSDHQCPKDKAFRFEVKDTLAAGFYEFPHVCPKILAVARDIDYWDRGVVLFRSHAFPVDEVPSSRIMERLKPVNWLLVFERKVHTTLYRDWFTYMWQEIKTHGLKKTLDSALDKLDAWEKIRLPGLPRQKRFWYEPLLGARGHYAYAGGLAKIPYGTSDIDRDPIAWYKANPSPPTSPVLTPAA